MKLLPVLTVLLVSASTGFAERVICYYANWSRFGTSPFKVEDIDAKLCTHIVYSFLGLETDGTVKSVDPWNDFGDEWTEGGIKKFMKLRQANPSVKLLIGVGGWNEGPLKFQSMVRSPEKRKAFLQSTFNFVKQHKFDGLEIDWVYHGSEGTDADKQGYSELVKEMKPKYKEAGYLLTITTSANPTIIERSYDIPKLAQHVDYINVMTYDFHGSWDKVTGHGSPLHPRRDDKSSLDVESAINLYQKSGAAPEKLNIALVGYGRTYTLVDPNRYGFNASASGPGSEEPLFYRSFCLHDKNNRWKKFRCEEQKVPYAVAGNQWVGYEDVQSLKQKVKFAKLRKLGGVTFWTVDMDDYKGACGSGKFPLLTAVKEEISKK